MKFILGIVGLGFLVFFHELGHFIAARIAGVKVDAFSIGMGPILFHYKFRETDYRISLIPLGGYCSMKGEQEFRKSIDNVHFEESKDSFYGVHPFKRFFIAFAGPLFNYIFGFFAFFLIAIIGYTYFTAGTKVSMADEIYPELHSAAHEAGLETGDVIISINQNKVSDWTEISSIIASHPNEDLVIVINRNETLLEFIVHSDLDKKTGAGKIGIVSDKDSVVQKEHKSKNIKEAIKEGFFESGKIISMTIKSIKILFMDVELQNVVSGPARITTMLGDTIQSGFSLGIRTGIVSTLEFLAIISISLFMTNLLPVPILDGGLILFAMFECLTGKKLSTKILRILQSIGIGIVLILMIFAFLGDILFFIKK